MSGTGDPRDPAQGPVPDDELLRADETLDEGLDDAAGDAAGGTSGGAADDRDDAARQRGALRAALLRQRLADALLRLNAEARDAVARERRTRDILAAVAAAEPLAAADPASERGDQPAEGGRRDGAEPDGDGLDDDGLDLRIADSPERDAVRQRVLHALLQVAHEDRAVREQRVRRIAGALAGAAGEPAGDVGEPAGEAGGPAGEAGARGRVIRFPRRWTRIGVAAAVLIAAGLVVRAAFGSAPTHELLEATSRELARDLDRRFRVAASRIDTAAVEAIGDHEMWLRPSADGELRFRIHIRSELVGEHEIGCDGAVVWRQSVTDPADREFVPVAAAEQVFARLQVRAAGRSELDDLDHFDIPRLIDLLANRGENCREGAAAVDADGHEVRVFYADALVHPDFGRLASVVVRVDATDHVVDVVHFVRATAAGVIQYRFEYRGLDPRPADFYAQPW